MANFNAITGVLESISPILDDLITSEEERGQLKLKFLELGHRAQLAQMEVNAKEAEHHSVFVSGWRPFIGWVCGIALVLAFLLFPIAEASAVYYTAFTGEHVDLSALPKFDWGTLGPLMMGLLGLGAARSYEKTKGVARTS